MSFIIGIDFGTTNSTVAFSSKEEASIEQFEISQHIASNLESKKGSLPSFFLFPLEREKPYLGWYARERGAELPDRVVNSVKSWLCHDMIDRRSSFLPLGDCEKKISPLEVAASFLQHLRGCWESTYPAEPFDAQTILITVPASFDPGARALILEASKLANFPDVRLMEEPLAAFYAWLYANRESWRKSLKVNDTILVVDIGGGTTDFSLITVQESSGDLSLERKAVGNHLLLGGDNIDLALAHYAQQKNNAQLDPWQFQSLIHACRSAKEQLLSLNPPNTFDVVVQGRGSRVIGGSVTFTLHREEVERALVEGFFPRVSLNEPLVQDRRSGITQVGLPYARDPRITAQLAHFLAESGAPLPTAVLFNGGTMKAAAFQKRLLEQLSEWKGEEVIHLEGGDLDYGVSRGAAYYGWTLANQGIRVKAPICRSYFIGVEGAAPAVPGLTPPLKKECLVPFGMEEGTEITLDDQQFTLLLDEPAFFRFFCQNTTANDHLVELHPIETVLDSQGREGKSVVVKLTAKVTELGMLELWCVAKDGQKWKLEFNIR
jgi:molecular chaperone DnaK (HSP70)